VPVTVGIADGAVGDPLLLYNQAEQATVAAVYSGKSEMYHDDSEAVKFNIVENTNSLGLVSHAIGNDRVEVVYQPIMKNRGSHIEVFEALVRIRADDGSLVPPGSFLESAKLSSYHKELTRIVFQKTFAKMARSDADFSVNISLEDIVDEDFVPFLKELFQRAPSCRSRCILEITESEGIRNFADVRTFMAEVRQIGYRFAIDDFGSGYSNLANLVRLPVDYVKFDGEIVQALLDDPRAEVVVSKINEIAKALKIRTIAEFVDSKELLSRVRALKIDYSQGFLIGAPSSRLNNSPDFL
jgi:EAL domain-containing protein (putative c-di-GMP-specific phosphodiesterase class I)